ncbi:ArsR/SmtB family transcription factor [Loigolactobacillus backii]|uniref:Transcriptional regulator n=1 Tax=Loigolactobacillus backii TaxID=375175 RepID=A0A192H5Q7_9LACO|nr:metalloregulator ArsR/SmtB family transcription factor [Loigolactobacillus backii]ANK60953.1 transcriptional regulator [Loigolactobacillus backii]ANK63542.1 transcriptional regulator [Loigolactobacillus backii]ANK65906.1 transcriptional regulator [Loigolactobacillus backii]ANK68380.1 transcriptional regulator [Loigolactobacillus backii]ANK70965.1 transcriptional regulator [Loigolactobacillus backii]
MTIEQRDLKMAEIFKVLSDANRLQMIRILYQSGSEMTCGEVGKKLEVSKSTVSYHFKVLRSVGLTNTRQEAQSKFLSLNLNTFKEYLPGFLSSL